MSVAILQNVVLHQHANLGPYNRLEKSSQQKTKWMQSRWDTLSYGTMYISTDLLWSKTAFISIHSFHSNTSHHTLPSLNPLRRGLFLAWKVYNLQPYVRICLIQEKAWPNWCRVCARMDSPFKKILPSLSWERGHHLWWSAMARSS